MDHDVSLSTANVPSAALLSHTDWIRALARSLVRDAAAADDLTQDTLLAALRGQPRNPMRLRPWLAGIARNLARQEHRGSRIQKGHETDRALAAFGEQAQSEGGDQASTLARAEAHRSLVEHVLAMSEPSRSLLLQRYFEGRRPVQIAALTGTSPAAVHSGLTRAHGALRARLEREGGKERWLATVGLVLLPEVGRQTAAAGVAATAPAAAGTLAQGIWGAGWATTWGLGSSVGAFALVAVAAFTVSFVRGGFGGVEVVDEARGAAPGATGGAERQLRDGKERGADPGERQGPRTEERRREAGEVSQGEASSDAPDAAPAAHAESDTGLSEGPGVPMEAPDEPVLGGALLAINDFHGRCVDGQGRPLPQIALGLFQPLDSRPEFWSRASGARKVGETTTDANGQFLFHSVAPGPYVVGPMPTEPGATSWLAPVRVPSQASDTIIDVKLPAAHWIVGQIELEADMGPREVQLTAFRGDVAVQATGRSALDGTFRIGPLAPGSYALSTMGSQELPWALPVTIVEAKAADTEESSGATALVLQAVTARRLSGEIPFAPGDDASKRGTVRFAKEIEDGEQEHRWIAQADVDAQGTYRVRGVEAGFYMMTYESRDGRRAALAPVVLHDEDEHSPNDSAVFGEMREVIARFPELGSSAHAVPAAVVEIGQGRYGNQGPCQVTWSLGGFTVGLPVDDSARIKHPVGPTGTVRVIVPMRGTEVELRDRNDRVLKSMKTSATEAGKVFTL